MSQGGFEGSQLTPVLKADASYRPACKVARQHQAGHYVE